jgi:hypothetical protein
MTDFNGLVQRAEATGLTDEEQRILDEVNKFFDSIRHLNNGEAFDVIMTIVVNWIKQAPVPLQLDIVSDLNLILIKVVTEGV